VESEKISGSQIAVFRNRKMLIMLYSGDQIVVFYGSNSWAYTRLGHISDKDESQMEELLSNGDVTLTISVEDICDTLAEKISDL
jgi:hypothetical protein